MKKCPFCAEEIQDDAIKCRYCGEWLEKSERNKAKTTYSAKLKTSDSFVKLDDLFKNMVLETLWGTAYPRQCPKTGYIKTRFNRHKIMHGKAHYLLFSIPIIPLIDRGKPNQKNYRVLHRAGYLAD